jgi:FkbM family methyltransferase
MGSVVTIDGIRMRIDPLMSPFNIRKLADGRHTAHERGLLSRHLRKDDRVLELGGGIGMVAIHCARAIGSDRVTSYEGNPRMEPLIRENYRLNGVEPDLHMKVLGRAAGTVTFYLAPRFSHSSMIDASGRGEPVTVPVEPYAEVHARIRPTVLIVDIQGSEIEFFEFADLDGVRMILVEFHPPLTGLRAIIRLRRYLRRIGYREATRSGTSCVFLRNRA